MAILRDIATIITKGTTPTSLGFNFQDEGINFVKIECIDENGNFFADKFDHISTECNEKLKRSQLQENDILFSIAGAIGRTAIVKKDILPANTNQALAIIRIPKGIINYSFLLYALKSSALLEQAEKKKQGVAQLNLSLKDIGDFIIPDISIEQQEQIAENLSKVDKLISLQKQQLTKLDELVKSRFIEMFGDPVNNSKNLPELTLPELGEFGRGVSKHRPRNDPKLLGGKYPLIQTGEVANSNLYITEYESTYSELGFKQSKLWQKGTLCITIAANIAKTAILTFDACFPDSVVGFKANDKTNNIFVHYWFSFFQAILEAQAPESAQKNINLKTLSELKIIVPPIELQTQFATFVEQTDKLKLEVKKSLEKLETLKKSLMQQYFG